MSFDAGTIKSWLSLLLVLVVIFAMSRAYFKQRKKMKSINSWIDEKNKSKSDD